MMSYASMFTQQSVLLRSCYGFSPVFDVKTFEVFFIFYSSSTQIITFPIFPIFNSYWANGCFIANCNEFEGVTGRRRSLLGGDVALRIHNPVIPCGITR